MKTFDFFIFCLKDVRDLKEGSSGTDGVYARTFSVQKEFKGIYDHSPKSMPGDHLLDLQ